MSIFYKLFTFAVRLATSRKWRRLTQAQVRMDGFAAAIRNLLNLCDPNALANSRLKFLDILQKAKNDGKSVIVFLPSIEWNAVLFQRPQQMALALAKQGAFVVYTYSYPSTTQLGRNYVEITKNMWLTHDCGIASHISGSTLIAHSTAWRTDVHDLNELTKQNNVLIYDYIDHIHPYITGEASIYPSYKLRSYCFGEGGNLILASAKELFEEAKQLSSHPVLLVQNGVDPEHYECRAAAMAHEPTELVRLRQSGPKALIGYFGAMAPWLWYDLINELSELRPDLGFVFVGPDYANAKEKLIMRKNVLAPGGVPYDKLPSYAKFFDVCFIPFAPGDIARTTSPLKLFEYFALGKPVVVTADMRECACFPEVATAGTLDEFSLAIDAALKRGRDQEHIARLKQLARDNSWDARAKLVLAGINSVARTLGPTDGNSASAEKFDRGAPEAQVVNAY